MKFSKISSMIGWITLTGCSIENPSPAPKDVNDSAPEIPFLNACACQMTVDWSQIHQYTDGSVLDPKTEIDAIDVLVFDLSKSEYITMANGERLTEYHTLDYVTFQPVYRETHGTLDTSPYDGKIMAIRVSAEKDSMLITALYEISTATTEDTLELVN